MEYVKLGRTGLEVSRLCLGCMTYGSTKWRDWVLEEDAARPFFREALGRDPERPPGFEGLEERPQRFEVIEPDAEAVKRYIEAQA